MAQGRDEFGTDRESKEVSVSGTLPDTRDGVDRGNRRRGTGMEDGTAGGRKVTRETEGAERDLTGPVRKESRKHDRQGRRVLKEGVFSRLKRSQSRNEFTVEELLRGGTDERNFNLGKGVVGDTEERRSKTYREYVRESVNLLTTLNDRQREVISHLGDSHLQKQTSEE